MTRGASGTDDIYYGVELYVRSILRSSLQDQKRKEEAVPAHRSTRKMVRKSTPFESLGVARQTPVRWFRICGVEASLLTVGVEHSDGVQRCEAGSREEEISWCEVERKSMRWESVKCRSRWATDYCNCTYAKLF
jgi:hypothetical protein